ncbi:MAG: 4Fe-4S dicluster domain-containing protein [Proteobacteria bacterium]|nr:4Fe-4S dicluster domain-containing protein [Pseudomonadota bacterium]MBU1234611.1 4Fe-4S dicluster domain-containing protein [Pseudomonadota bacterium]MBU1416984.1 4Fe-4S dicluster domain-containing protein [Pseudomonadota bacterium]MBU1453680.1 4Fe-4S dicluster domain-containing protein [Pseudomonadota bacterium]
MNIKDLEKEKNEGLDLLPSEERRKFLKIGLAVTGVFLGGSVLSLTSVKSAKGGNSDSVIPAEGQYPYTKHYGMIMRQNNCVGCEKCVEACRETNHVPVGHGAWRTTIQERLTTVDGVEKREFRPILCNHCNRPPCVRVCPTKATYKDPETGIVVMDYKKCIGCKTCMAACPYNARYFNHDKYAIDKCNFCLDTRLGMGEKETACAAACPAKVRIFGDIKDKQSEIYRLLHEPDNAIWVLRPETGALPNVFYMNA